MRFVVERQFVGEVWAENEVSGVPTFSPQSELLEHREEFFTLIHGTGVSRPSAQNRQKLRDRGRLANKCLHPFGGGSDEIPGHRSSFLRRRNVAEICNAIAEDHLWIVFTDAFALHGLILHKHSAGPRRRD
ncbi:hypothetical protein JQ608_37115 [Bradyrhizobium liaoningense]|uniref:hypothetical protein n=1 Tax=Bradyrhizobium liaoningense TaxID=43992 RepID=UPI001BACC019|nr:hypothetical protein [Bradyrhizobium liaoningense]MBR0882653.1 hypothetical protein [Bradyrhizobium liaoningense]